MSERLAVRFCRFLSVILIVMGVTETTAAVSTTATIDLLKSERAIVNLCDERTKEELNADPQLAGRMLAAFEDHMAICRTAGRPVSWQTVEAFRKAADCYRTAQKHDREVLVRMYDRILEVRPDHQDALKMELTAADQYDIHTLHRTDSTASPTEAIRRYKEIVEKYPLILDVYRVHQKLAGLAEFTDQIELAKEHLEFMIGTDFDDLRGPRPMSRARLRQRHGSNIPDTVVDRMDSLEKMKERFEGMRHSARKMLVFFCVQYRAKTIEEMRAEYTRLRAKFPSDERLSIVIENALKQGPGPGGIQRKGQ